jgi:hypothetical protein
MLVMVVVDGWGLMVDGLTAESAEGARRGGSRTGQSNFGIS